MFFMLNRFVIQYKLVTLHPLFAKAHREYQKESCDGELSK